MKRRARGHGWLKPRQASTHSSETISRDSLIVAGGVSAEALETGFFRDPAAFEALKNVVYPAILKNRLPEDAIRIWVLECSTGEEVYSHAIALLEYLQVSQISLPIQIFGTDLSEEAIRKARSGEYKEGIRTDVSGRRLQRFFIPTKDGYRISKTVR